MQETPNLKLPIYELDDMANLSDGYNEAMNKIDESYKQNENRFPITSSNIEDGTITAVDIANGAITTNKIATAAVTADKLAADAINPNSIPDNAINTNNIADGAITNAKIADDAVSTAKLTDNSVTSSKLAQDAVTTANIADGAITAEKLASDVEQTSSIRGVLWLGDSYSDPTVAAIDWVQTIVKPLINASFIINKAKAGACINTTHTTGIDIYPQIPTIPVEGVTDVVIYAGHNDVSNGNLNITTQLQTILTKLNQDYPSAKIHLFIPNTTRAAYSDLTPLLENVNLAILNSKAFNVINYSYVWLFQTYYGGSISTNDGHPTAQGLPGIAQHIAQCILGNNPVLHKKIFPETFTYEGPNSLFLEMVNNTVYLYGKNTVKFPSLTASNSVVATFADHTMLPKDFIISWFNTSKQITEFFRLNNDPNSQKIILKCISGIAENAEFIVDQRMYSL